jgi:hypothetical protein
MSHEIAETRDEHLFHADKRSRALSISLTDRLCKAENGICFIGIPAFALMQEGLSFLCSS